MAAVALSAALVGLAGPAARIVQAQGHRRPVARHVVRPGDTLWSIAQDRVGAGGDPRPLIDAILTANDGGTALTPGRVLTIPLG